MSEIKLRTRKKTCGQCPFKKNSIKGYLGGFDADEIINSLNSESLYSCHMERQDNPEENRNKILLGKQSVCKGYLHSANVSAKRFGRHPLHGEQLKELQDNVSGDSEESNILKTWEFKKYHEQ